MSLAPLYGGNRFDIGRFLVSAAGGMAGSLFLIDWGGMDPMRLVYAAARVVAARLVVDFARMKYPQQLSPMIAILATLGVWSAIKWYEDGTAGVENDILPTVMSVLALESAFDRGMLPFLNAL